MTLRSSAARRLVLLLAAGLMLALAPAANGQTSPVIAAQGSQRFTIDTNLRSPSGLSAWAIDRYLLANTPLPAIGAAFKAAELKHGVNARYLLAHAMLETGFGTSYFALRYRNLFGWNALDRDPGKYASQFPTYAAGIDHVASQIAERYLTPTGKYYGGAPTLRGMHMYASDPGWEDGIARIANMLPLQTLAGREFEVSTPTLKSSPLVGVRSTVGVTFRPSDRGGALPDGLRVAFRWRPVSIVETSNPAKKAPEALPDFTLTTARTSKGRLSAFVLAPKIPGRYRLELQLRDSDGTPFDDGSKVLIPGAQVRVYAKDAVTYALEHSEEGVTITLANVGRKPIPALGEVGASGVSALTTVAVWSLPRSGEPALLARIPLAADVAPGKRWTGVIPTEFLAPALPGLILVRLEVAGAPNRFITSPPGVFQIDVVPSPKVDAAPEPTPAASTPTPTPTPDPAIGPSPSPGATADTAVLAASPDPLPSAGADPAASASPSPSFSTDPPVNVPVVLPRIRIRPVTPGDPASAVLLGTEPKAKKLPATPLALTPTKAAVTVTTGVNSVSVRTIKAIRYAARVTLLEGTGTVRLTNTGNVTYHAVSPPATPGTPAGPATVPDTRSALVVSAVPATCTLDAPVVVRVPLVFDLAPGQSVDVPIALPSLPGVQPAFLVTVRLDTSDPAERPTSAAIVFWMRGAPAGPAEALVTTPLRILKD